MVTLPHAHSTPPRRLVSELPLPRLLHLPLQPISAARTRLAAATALAAASVQAKLLADQEEREVQRLVLQAIEHQFKKVNAKLQVRGARGLAGWGGERRGWADVPRLEGRGRRSGVCPHPSLFFAPPLLLTLTCAHPGPPQYLEELDGVLGAERLNLESMRGKFIDEYSAAVGALGCSGAVLCCLVGLGYSRRLGVGSSGVPAMRSGSASAFAKGACPDEGIPQATAPGCLPMRRSPKTSLRGWGRRPAGPCPRAARRSGLTLELSHNAPMLCVLALCIRPACMHLSGPVDILLHRIACNSPQ